MSALDSTTQDQGLLNPRKPLDSQKNAGTDMSIMVLVQTNCPGRFAYQDQHYIRGLNAETLARVFLPAPPWLLSPEYTLLQPDPDEACPCIFFSLNLSIYNQNIDPEEWTEQWFFMNGRVHPYALTWKVEQLNGVESDDHTLIDYTIPTLIVRDQGYQPINPRPFAAIDHFPMVPPIVSFTGPIIGSGRTHLRKDILPNLSDVQLKCCGFVQLSSFIAPGDPSKPPYRGFHPFQAFLIFPIHANPWASLCKKMIERQDTQFQANALVTCTGKIAGLLHHKSMLHPPSLEQDYVFIVVPDSWTFLDRTGSNSTSRHSSSITEPKHQSSGLMAFGDALAKFTSPKKDMINQPSHPSNLTSDKPTTPPIKRHSAENYQTPTKRLCKAPGSGDHDDPQGSSSSPLNELDQLGDYSDPTVSPEGPEDPSITAVMPADSSNRPHRSRHPPKKYLEPD